MNIETKTVRDVTEYLHFGWKHTEDTQVRSGRSSHTEHVLARDKDMPNYRLITALESKYFLLKGQKKVYNPIEPLLVFAGLLFFIIPGIIYLAFKASQENDIKRHNAEIQRQMDAVLEEVRPLL